MALSESKKTNHLITIIATGIIILLTILFIYWLRFASAEGGYDYITKWGSTGTSNSQFEYPSGIAVDSNNNSVYVVDSFNSRIQKFDTNGVFATKWGTDVSNDGEFNMPKDVAVDSSGNVYVTDPSNMYVKKFNSNGTFISKWEGNGHTDSNPCFPVGIAIDSDDNIFVTYFIINFNTFTEQYGIQKFNSSIVYTGQKISSKSSTAGNFYYPQGIEVDSTGNVYVVDTGNNRIQKFNNNLTYSNIKWGAPGTANSQFRAPTDVSIDADGNIYVTDTYNNRIQKFDSNGNFITKWGRYGNDIGRFILPEGIAVDNDGNVYVTDTENNRIQKFAMKPITINTGNNFTNTPNVTLKFNTVSFNVTNAVNVKFENSTSALEVTPTEAFSTTKAWTLAFNTGDGVKTVYAQLEDDASNILGTISDTIILDRKPPTVAHSTYPTTVKRGKYVKLKYRITDSQSWKVYVKIKVVNPSGITKLNKDLGAKSKNADLYYSYKILSTAKTGNYYYRVTATDYAGNIRASVVKKFKVY